MKRAILLTVGIALTACGWGQKTAKAELAPQKRDITAEQIIEKSIEATGGREAHEKITSTVAKATLEVVSEGVTANLEVYAKTPNKRFVISSVESFGEFKQGFDGTVAWVENPVQGFAELEGEALAIVKRESTFNADLKWRELYRKAELKGKDKLGDRDVYVVELIPAQGTPVTRYYDSETFLLQRVDMVQPTTEGLAVVETRLSDYREFGGRKVPFTVTQLLPDEEVIIKITDVQNNVEIDDAKFVKPAQPPPQP